jgi:ABC-type sulfate/molybdate transport systems ATPase subunit
MLRVEDLYLRAGDFELQGVSLRVESGEYFVLMGPTGSGKSLLARCICGLVRPGAGRVWVGSREVTSLEPRFRRVGYVPQDCGLFPHLDVAHNLTFPLRLRAVGAPDEHRRPRLGHPAALERLSPIIDMVGIRGLLGRSTITLSGGERQKIALARALATEPKLLVLDEPVSALDEPTRFETCRDLRRVQRELGIPTIHISHNVAEANLVADRVGVLIQGKLAQVAPLAEMLSAPADPAVRRLLGSRDRTPGSESDGV